MSDSCCNTACADPIQAITVNNNTISASSTLTVAVAALNPAVSYNKQVTITVAQAGYWLLSCVLTDASTPSDVETLTPPDNPGVNHFQKITNSAGVSTFVISHSSAGTWYLHVFLVGKAVTGTVDLQ